LRIGRDYSPAASHGNRLPDILNVSLRCLTCESVNSICSGNTIDKVNIIVLFRPKVAFTGHLTVVLESFEEVTSNVLNDG